MRAFKNWVLGSALIVALASAGLAQSAPPQPAVSPSDLVRRVIANELKPQAERNGWFYHSEKEEAGKKQTKRVVQTRQGSLERLVAVDGLPLSADKQREEAERLEKIANHPKEWQKLEQDQKKDSE